MSRRNTRQFADPLGRLQDIPNVGVILAAGDGAPTNSIAGYAPGALYFDYTNGVRYQNVGTYASSTFSASAIASSTSFVINENSEDVDIRFESNANANFFVIDSSACGGGQLAIGAAIPTNPQALVAILPPANASGVTASQSYYHFEVLPGGATTIPAGTAPIVATAYFGEPNITATGTVTVGATVYIADAPTEGATNFALWVDSGAVRLDGVVYIGATSNAGNLAGLTIRQGAADDEILSLGSTDVAHGMTSVCETDLYGRFLKFSATDGGLFVDGLADTGSTGLQLRGVIPTDSATRSTSGIAPVMIDAALKSTTTVTANAADKNIVCFRTNGTTRFILDSDGDSFQDVGVAWTNFDGTDDLVLLNSLAHHVAREGNPIGREFGGWLKVNRPELERLKLVYFNEDTDGRPFVNMSRLTMLLVGGLRQLGQKVAQMAGLEDRLTNLEARLALAG